MKPFAIALVSVPVLGSVAAVFLVLFLLTFPWENSEPISDRDVFFAVAGIAIGVVLPAIVCWVGVVFNRILLAWIGLGVHLLGVLVLLGWALGESDHSDGRLLLCALVGAGCGVAGVVLAARPRDVNAAAV